ncbi:MAG: hypothetical protein KME11_19285 [Timaviella obliquedivisa GSE-PSE-MK23-08B]|jgi:hypothetical protein|nr:hypothetical protein [Timaviella obliquedivisa GSE-PSE-MK23-08B]
MHYIFLQNALTFTYDAVLVSSTAFFGTELVLHLKQKWDALEVPKPAQLPAASIPLLESTAIPVESVAIEEKVALPIDLGET